MVAKMTALTVSMGFVRFYGWFYCSILQTRADIDYFRAECHITIGDKTSEQSGMWLWSCVVDLVISLHIIASVIQEVILNDDCLHTSGTTNSAGSYMNMDPSLGFSQ